MGVLLHGKVKDGVGGVEVGAAPRAVRQPGDVHLPEEGLEGALVTPLDAATRDPLGIHHLDPGFPAGAQIEVILEQLADQLAALSVEELLELTVGEGEGIVAAHQAQYRREAGLGGGEGRGGGCGQRDDHDRRPTGARATTSCARPWSPSASTRALRLR